MTAFEQEANTIWFDQLLEFIMIVLTIIPKPNIKLDRWLDGGQFMRSWLWDDVSGSFDTMTIPVISLVDIVAKRKRSILRRDSDDPSWERFAHNQVVLLTIYWAFLQSTPPNDARLLEVCQWDDHGATFLYNNTKKDPAILAPQDNMSMAYFLAWDSPRMQYLCKVILEVVVNGKRSLAAIARWQKG